MSQRHFSIRTYHCCLLALLVFIFFQSFILPDLANAQDTLIVNFQWTTRIPVPGVEYYGKTPNFPKPIISFIKVEDEQGLHVPGLASITSWLKPDDTAEIGVIVRDIWKQILEYHDEDPTIPADQIVRDYEVREIRDKGVSVALAMDFSRTTSENKQDQAWPEVINAGKAFINELQLDGEGDRAALIKVDFIATEEQAFTDVKATLLNVMNNMSGGPPGGSSILSGIELGVELCKNEPATNRRIVVIHSDGEETVELNQKEAMKRQIIDEANGNDILIFTILTETDKDSTEWAYYKEIADSTGGKFYKDITTNDLDSVYTDIYRRLRGGYYLAHKSTDPVPDGTKRWIEVDSLIVDGDTGSGRGWYIAPKRPANVTILKRVFSDSTVVRQDRTDHFAFSGETVRYELDITSNWYGRADSIVVTDVLPDSIMNVAIERKGLLLPDSVDIQFSDADYTVYPDSVRPDSVVWMIPTSLDSGKTVRITYHAQVSPWMPLNPIELVNSAKVTCDTDTFPGDSETQQILYGYGFPDLQVNCIEHQGGTASPHYPLLLQAEVSNFGIVEAPGTFRVGFYRGTELLAVDTVNGLSGNERKDVEGLWTNPPPGLHYIRVVVDLDKDVRETNELNNEDTCDGVRVAIDTLIVDVKKVAIADEAILGRMAAFPNPVLTWIGVVDQNDNFIHGLADTTRWLGLNDPVQWDNTTPVDSVWHRIWEYHRSDTTRPNNPNVKTDAFGVVEIDEMGEPYYVLSHMSSDTLKDADERVVDVTLTHFQLAGRDTSRYTPPLGDGDLDMDKTVMSDSSDANNNYYAQPGDTVTYTLTVRNIGHLEATDVMVQDNLPGEMKFLSSEKVPESVQGDTLIRWKIDSIDQFETIAFDYRCLVEDTLRIFNDIPMVNEATVKWALDANTHNDTAKIPVIYDPLDPADIRVKKISNVETVDPGGTIQYTVTVSNQGYLSCRDVKLFDRLPANVTFVKDQSGTASWNQGTYTLSWPSIVLQPGESKTFVYTCTVDTVLRRGTHYLTNRFWGTSNDDNTPDNNADSVTVVVNVNPPKLPEIELSESLVEPGDTVRVRVRVHHDIASKDLLILYESDNSFNTTYGTEFLQDTVLIKYQWKFVTPDFQNLDTQIQTDGVEEETVHFRLITTDHFGDRDTSNVATLVIRGPKEFYLGENVFRPLLGNNLKLEFKLSASGSAEINIYDISGAFIRKFSYGHLNAGQHYEYWDGKDENGKDMGSGIYVAILTSVKFQQARKFIIVR